jgi:N-acetylglucosaminyl-diphospho-decaprenol L-rhamnosyltransferase
MDSTTRQPSSQPPVSLSVIFVTFNSANELGAAVSSVRAHLPDPQIIVVDNGSTDQTCRVVDEMVAVQLIHGHGNIGFGAGVNLGAHAASGDLLLVLNPDTSVIHADAESLLDLARHSPLGMLGCLVHSEGKYHHLMHTEWGWRRELYWMMMAWFLVPREMTVHRPRPKLTKGRSWISGAAFVVSRSEFCRIGGFDEDIFLYFEDTDLSRRYRQQGAGVGTTDAVVIAHHGQGSSRDNQAQIQAWALLSLIELVAKRTTDSRDVVRVSRSAIQLLVWIGAIGRYVGRLPIAGRRIRQKGKQAELVRSKLLASVDAPPLDTAYVKARSAIAPLVRR